MIMSAPLRAKLALAFALALTAGPFESSRADAPAATDSRDVALLSRMTLDEKINQLMLLSKGTMTGPDSAGRPNKSAEDLAREGIGFQMSAFEWSAKDVNRIQRIAIKESRLGIPVVFADRHHSRLLDGVSGAARPECHVRSRRRACRWPKSPGWKAIHMGSAGPSRPWSIIPPIHAGAA